ncbi:MAG: hypothetical protein D6780_07705 [Candidatus Dadabacteria bacterium]|nr:MAG: hypothetical protein D6780_07705 [Candidatus Dadabacteria bacterium]
MKIEKIYLPLDYLRQREKLLKKDNLETAEGVVLDQYNSNSSDAETLYYQKEETEKKKSSDTNKTPTSSHTSSRINVIA